METIKKRKDIFIEQRLQRTITVAINGEERELSIKVRPDDPIGIMYVYDRKPKNVEYLEAWIDE